MSTTLKLEPVIYTENNSFPVNINNSNNERDNTEREREKEHIKIMENNLNAKLGKILLKFDEVTSELKFIKLELNNLKTKLEEFE